MVDGEHARALCSTSVLDVVGFSFGTPAAAKPAASGGLTFGTPATQTAVQLGKPLNQPAANTGNVLLFILSAEFPFLMRTAS